MPILNAIDCNAAAGKDSVKDADFRVKPKKPAAIHCHRLCARFGIGRCRKILFQLK